MQDVRSWPADRCGPERNPIRGQTNVRSIATPLAIDLSWFSDTVAGQIAEPTCQLVPSSLDSQRSSIRGTSPNRKASSLSDSSGSASDGIESCLDTLNEFPYGSLYAKRILRSEGGARALFDATVKLMQTLPQRLKMGTETTLRSMCALNQMLMQILTQYPITDTTALCNRLLPAIEDFCMWPCPYGQLARSMRSMVEAEVRAPGAAYRKILFEEHPMLSLAGMSKQDSLSADGEGVSSAAVRRQFVWSEFSSRVSVL